MPKLVIIGAGSGFGGRLSLDTLSRDALRNTEICLCDLNEKRLSQVYAYVKNTIEHYNLPAVVRASTDRCELLPGADFVVTSIAVGGGAYYGDPFNFEVRIPRKYGVDQSVADSMSVGATFRFLCTGPVQLQILRDVERLAPNAVHLNHTNPMSMLSNLHATQTSLKTVGLCHGIISTNAVGCNFLGIDPEQARYTVAVINHLAWFLEWTHEGRDVYAMLKEKLSHPDDPDVKKFLVDESVRAEVLKQFGYFPTESNRHDSEYMPYFRRTRALRDQYSLPERTLTDTFAGTRDWMSDGAGDKKHGEIVRSHEYTTGIMEAVVTDVPFRFNGNVLNRGFITNLPQNLCVEVPCIADAHGIHGTYVGALPTQLAALNAVQMYIQDLAVQAVVNRDREAAFHAVALDPNVAAVCSLPEIRRMFDELWEAEAPHLVWFDKNHSGPVPETCAP